MVILFWVTLWSLGNCTLDNLTIDNITLGNFTLGNPNIALESYSGNTHFATKIEYV